MLSILNPHFHFHGPRSQGTQTIFYPSPNVMNINVHNPHDPNIFFEPKITLDYQTAPENHFKRHARHPSPSPLVCEHQSMYSG